MTIRQYSLLVLLLTLGHSCSFATTTPPAAAVQLKRIFHGFRRVRGISMKFICRKTLVVLKQPFISGGTIAIMQPDRVRFSTRWPYRSCFILRGQRVYSRTQDDRRWHQGSGSGQPVLEQIMRQFAHWSLGQVGGLGKDYRITEGIVAVPTPPRRAGRQTAQPRAKAVKATPQQPFPQALQLFTLTPRSAALRHAVGHINLGFSLHHPQLRFIEMFLAHGNATIYWLVDIQRNPKFVADEFRPKGRP